ncbi:putative reverse transcriptase domain-containing protein [Tanacetum coccineum]
MMTTEYCPATEIQRMEQELWTLTLKGDDIEAYSNRFHELVLMCPELVLTEKKKIEKYVLGFAERIKGNITSSKPATLHEAINMARELVTWRRIVELGFRVQNDGARGRAYVVIENPQQNPNVVTGTFLLNDHYACILFDSSAEKSFVSFVFTHFINIAPATLNTSYKVELADGKVVSTNTILRSCTLVLLNHVFKIDLLPTRLGSFDVIIGMDWLAYHRALIDCYEKIVRIPLPNGKILEVQGERASKDLRSLACIKADEKKLDDIRVVRDFPEVFPDDLLGLPLVREIEFRIDLIPGASPVVRSPYRLAPSEMLELSNQLKELQEKGFIRPSHSPWGAPVLFVKKKDGHVVNHDGIHRDPSKVESVKNWKTPESPTEIRSFLGLAVHLRADKMYYDLRDLYWWPETLSDFLQQPKFLEWKCGKDNNGLVTKFLKVDYKTEKLAKIYTNEIVARHGVPVSIISDRNGRFTSHLWQGFQEALGKLAPRYVRPFKIVKCVGLVAYRLKLPQELSCVHDMFHVSNLKKCLAKPDVQVPLDEIEIDENLRFVEEPIEIVERDVKKLKRRRIPLVKVRWNSRQGAEYTWEHEDQFRIKYPHLFSEPVPSSSAAT